MLFESLKMGMDALRRAQYSCRTLAVATAFCAAAAAHAGTELIQNGDFEAGSTSDQTWGAYANSANISGGKYSNPNWTVGEHGGLAKPNGTWMTSGLDVGTYALFLQSNTGYNSSASQDVTVTEAGTYRVSFNWTARPSHGAQQVKVWFGGILLDTITCNSTALFTYTRYVRIDTVGTKTFLLEAVAMSGDRATCFDSVSIQKVDGHVWTGGGNSNAITDAGNWGGTAGDTATFSSDDYLVFGQAASAILDANVTVGGVVVSGDGAVAIAQAENASNVLTVDDVASAAGAEGSVTFGCLVQFSGAYRVTADAAPMKFPGGATATCPDNDAMRTAFATVHTRTLDGTFDFTADWIVNNVGDYPWIVASNAVVRGQVFSGLQTSHHRILRVEETGYARFSYVTNGWDRGDIDIDGTLEATEEMIVRTKPSSASDLSHFGRSGNIGTVKAKRIAKAEHAIAQSLIPNLIVGSGGMGSLCKDYLWRFDVDTTITASADFEFLGVYNSGNPVDWGISISPGITLTVNVPEGKTVTCGIGVTNTGAVRKTGAGTLVMTDTFDNQSGFNKNYSGGTIVDEGVVRLVGSVLGTGPVPIAAGARLDIGTGVAVSNQIDGEGTLALADGATLTVSGKVPWGVGTVEVASGATVNVTNNVSGAFAFLTGVDAANLSQFKFGDYPLTVAGDTLCYADGATTGAYVWNGASGADWSVAGNWLVDGAAPATAPASTDTVIFQNAAPVAVGGTDTLTVTKIVTLSDDEVTFNCPVQFAGTYLVENAAVAPVFAGGATATYPDASLTSMNIASHAFRGTVTFSEDWKIPHQTAGNPFVVTEGASLTGKVLSGTTYAAGVPELRIDTGAVATFDSVSVGGILVFQLNGGRLVATGDITLKNADFGDYRGNIGTVEAHGVFKSERGGNIVNYVTNFVVGAGGFGMYRADYNFQFNVNARLTAKDHLTIYKPLTSDGSKENDWGLNLNSKTLTIDTAGYVVTFDSCTIANAGVIVKEGEGELIMQDRQKQHTGGTILNGGLTTVKLAGALGYGTATVNDGATLSFADNVINFAYPIVVNAGGTLANAATVADSSTLTLNAGAIIKPAQNTFFDLSAGTLNLPAEGTVTVDMTDFTIVNGVANPVLAGVSDGDEAKFTALVPAGVVGALSVSGGVLSYTATSGGSAAADLFWHPVGDSIWSTSVDAWTNAAGSQVAFAPYANVTVADAATISLPDDVSANDVRIAADDDVALNGVGKLGGPGAIVKTGDGTFTFNATGGLDAQPIIVSNGVFKVGENLADHALGAIADTSPVIVADGGTLDLNYNNSSNTDDARSKVTRDKLVKIAGDGHEGQGAIVNNNLPGYRTISQLVLDDDASVGGSVRFDVRGGLSGYVRNSASIYGPNKTLTVKNSGSMGIVYADVTLGSLLIADGGAVQMEGTGTYTIPNGIHLADGTFICYNANPGTLPIVADSGDNTIRVNSGTPTIGGAITVAPGATLTHAAGSAIYTGAINGALGFTGGNMYFSSGVPASGFTVNGTTDTGYVYMRQSGTFTGANITANLLCVADVADSTVNVTFNNSTLNLAQLFLGWGGASTGYLSIGPGTTATAGKFAIGDTGTSTSKTIKSVLSVDGGTLHHTGDNLFIAHNGPHSDLIVNSGTLTVDKATIKLRNNAAALGGYNTSRFIQNGGVFNYGGPGFTANFEDNTEDGQIILKGGEFDATANWSIPNWISTCFKGGDADGWTLNQADGTTATWTTALQGDGDVTLNGAATLVGNKEVQGAVGGKWTVGDGFTAGLQGAASLLGGLAVGEGATATVDIATNRSAVFTARDFGHNPGETNGGNCLTNRFNKQFGGTTRGTITHDMTFFFTKYAAADRPFGNLNYQSTYAVGQFYVEDGKAGEWSFTGICDDWVYIWIDGELVVAPAQGKQGTGTKNLAAGWHSFRHVIIDNGGGYGNAQTAGYKDPTMSSYVNFSTKNLKMRPAADMGDANNANTIRWSHYKGDSTTVTASTFKNQEFAWDFCCITNNLQKLQWYGKTDTTWYNTYTVNRFEGWFYVTPENAGKEWTFRSNYDDRAALWIDGVDSGLDGNSDSTLTYKVVLAQGWHKFRIQTADFTGNAGPWSGKGNSVSYQVADGAQTLFSEATLAMTVCPDGYVQGGVTLASGATLANAATGVATVYGDVTATGTGATMSGGFKFEGGKLAFQNVAPNANDLSTVLAFTNPADDYLADVGAITVDFTAKPTRSKVKVGPAGGLTAETAAQKVSVTMNGEPVKASCLVEDGNLKVRLARGTYIIVR